MIVTKEIDLETLQEQLTAASVVLAGTLVVLELQGGTTLVAVQDAQGSLVELPQAAMTVVNAHVAPDYNQINTNIRQQVVTIAQSTVGIDITALTTAQRSALLAVLLYKAGAITADMKIKPLNKWAS